jgi:hypothetical protein
VPSYIDDLTEDRARVVKALMSLIDEEEEIIRNLTQALTEYRDALDRAIIRTMIFRNLYGPTQALTQMAEADAQEASGPVTETSSRLEREMQMLRVYREALKQVQEGVPFPVAISGLM